MDEAKALQDYVLSDTAASSDHNAKINAAARLMTGRAYPECIQAYAAIANAHPEELGLCEAQIGAAYFFLGQYENAISFYQSAERNGADARMMKFNLDEATAELKKHAR